MIKLFKQKLMVFFENLHLRIFGSEMGEEMRLFVHNLGWMGAGAVLSAFFIFIANLAAGRLLGPIEYGKYSIIISAGQLFIIPMLLGINTSAIYYLARQRKDQKKIITTSYFTVIFLIIISAIILFLFRNFFTNLFKINNTVFLFAIIYASVLSLKYISEAVIKGLHRFKLLSKLNILSAFFILVSFFLLVYLTKDYTFRNYAAATIIGLAIFFLVVIFANRLRVSYFDKNMLKKLMHYGLFASVGSISGFALNNIDRLVLNNYLGFAAVGLFAAYLSAASFFSGQLLQIFIDVFFPSISAIKDKNAIYQKIKRLLYISALPLLILNGLATAVIIKLYGAQYEFNYLYILGFSLLGALTFCQNILWWFIASFGKRGIRFTSTSGILVGFFNIGSIIVLVKSFGFTGAIIGLNITSLIIIIISIIYLGRKNVAINK